MNIALAKGGPKERQAPLAEIKIPDLWHIAMRQGNTKDRELILEAWHLAHDLLESLKHIESQRKEAVRA
jgi:hypothetical protein